MNIITNTVYMYVSDFETIPISAPLLKLANAGATSVPMEKSSGSPKFLAMWWGSCVRRLQHWKNAAFEKKRSIYTHQYSTRLGGFKLFEKYARQIGSFPQVGVKMKNDWNDHLV